MSKSFSGNMLSPGMFSITETCCLLFNWYFAVISNKENRLQSWKSISCVLLNIHESVSRNVNTASRRWCDHTVNGFKQVGCSTCNGALDVIAPHRLPQTYLMYTYKHPIHVLPIEQNQLYDGHYFIHVIPSCMSSTISIVLPYLQLNCTAYGNDIEKGWIESC